MWKGVWDYLEEGAVEGVVSGAVEGVERICFARVRLSCASMK